MTPRLRPLQSPAQILAFQWIDRPRSRFAFQSQRYLFRRTESEQEGFSYLKTSQYTKREELLRRFRFPRENTFRASNIWWATKYTPLLLITVLYLGVRWPFRRMWDPPPPEKKGVVKNRIGRFFNDFVSQDECFRLLNTTVKPWGRFHKGSGDSMQPTFGGNPAITYSSYAYVDRQDIRVGDVVLLLGPNYDKDKVFLCKRIAVLEGNRIWTTGLFDTQRILWVPSGHIFALGDNPPGSGDSRQLGPLPIEAVWAKVHWQWGLDGFQWPYHGQRPWEENKALEVLAPGQNRPTHHVSLTKQPEKNLTTKPRPKVRSLVPLPPPPPKKQRKDPREKG